MSIVNLGTYPPKQCGIATFSMDLRNSLQINGETIDIMAVSDDTYQYQYPPEVVFNIKQENQQDYIKAAGYVNSNPKIDLVIIQHEYGIFGGLDGEYILDFTRYLHKPYVLITHTVLPHPVRKQKFIINKLGMRAAAVVCMTHRSSRLLSELYGIAPNRVQVIPHGVPEFQRHQQDKLKADYGLTGRQVISTFGLIGPGKGLELGIQAIKYIADDYPEVCYLILGQTHPMLKKHEGESYRQMLENMVKDLNLSNQVKFVNKYLSDRELGEYLYLTDIYLSPYPDPNQAVSGTMAFALGCGRAIVSTSYAYAQEVLSGVRGLMAQNPDPEELALLLRNILSDPQLKSNLQTKAWELGQNWSWPCIGKQYREVFQKVNTGLEPREAGKINYGGL